MTALLAVEGLAAGYGQAEAISDVSLRVDAREAVAIVGANGAGKSTTLRAISGLVRTRRGRMTFDGADLTRLDAPAVVRLGIVHVPEGREIFARMTVVENLRLGAWRRGDRRAIEEDLERQMQRFPVLGSRRTRPAGALSGGEQQMLAIARALMGRPRLLLMDEPSLGLAPQVVDQVFDIVDELRGEGNTILLVEQNALRALEVCDRAYVIEGGRTTIDGTGRDLLEDARVRSAYLGVGAA